MPLFQSWRREAICLLLGGVAGVAGALMFRSVSDGSQTAAQTNAGSSVAGKRMWAEVSAVPGSDATTAPLHHRPAKQSRGATAWKIVASEYLENGSDRAHLHSALYQLDAVALRKLAANAATWPRGGHTLRALREIYRRWAEVDPAAAFSQAQFLAGETQDTVLFEAMRGFVSAQPSQAAAYFASPPAADAVGSLRNPTDRRLMLGLALAAWSEQDSQATAGFLSQLPDWTLYPGPAGSLGEEFARQDPAAALNWALHLSDQSARSNALQGVISAWAEVDPSAVASYVLGFSGDVGQNELIGAFATKWASQDLPAAARWTAGQSGAIQAKAAASVADQWTTKDPTGAAAWASQLPEAARPQAYSSIAENWAASDPVAARDWLDNLSAGAAKDAAIGSYVKSWRNDDPGVDKATWAGKISDPEKRDEITVEVLNSWLSNAPLSARQWINQTDLPATVTSKLKEG